MLAIWMLLQNFLTLTLYLRVVRLEERHNQFIEDMIVLCKNSVESENVEDE